MTFPSSDYLTGSWNGLRGRWKTDGVSFYPNYTAEPMWNISGGERRGAVSYDRRASHGNQWSVPVGPFVGKTIKIGRELLNIRLGVNYSVVSPDDFGTRASIVLLVTPVIRGLVGNPIFDGKR